MRGSERVLPALLTFFEFPRHVWRKLRTTNAIERCFVEVRRRTRPMVVFINVQSVDRIINALFSRFNGDRKTHTLKLHTQLDVTRIASRWNFIGNFVKMLAVKKSINRSH